MAREPNGGGGDGEFRRQSTLERRRKDPSRNRVVVIEIWGHFQSKKGQNARFSPIAL